MRGLGSFLQSYGLWISGTPSYTQFPVVSHRTTKVDYLKGDYRLIKFVE